MKCIGRECAYNKCNSGNYCNLLSACFTKEGDNCVINEEIEIALEALDNAKEVYERLIAEKQNINYYQNRIMEDNDNDRIN